MPQLKQENVRNPRYFQNRLWKNQNELSGNLENLACWGGLGEGLFSQCRPANWNVGGGRLRFALKFRTLAKRFKHYFRCNARLTTSLRWVRGFGVCRDWFSGKTFEIII